MPAISFDQFMAALVDAVPSIPDGLQPNTALTEVGLDSLAMFELLVAACEVTRLDDSCIQLEDVQHLTTLSDVYALFLHQGVVGSS